MKLLLKVNRKDKKRYRVSKPPTPYYACRCYDTANLCYINHQHQSLLILFDLFSLY